MQVYLEADLGGESRARNGDRMAVQGVVDQVVVRDFPDVGAEHLLHQLDRLGALNLDRRHVHLVDVHVELAGRVDSLGPKKHVGVGDAEPELVVGHSKQHRVVDDAAVLIAEDDVPGLHRGQQGVHVAGDQHVHQIRGIGALYPDLAFDGHVPHADMLGEVLVLRIRPPSSGLMYALGGTDDCTSYRPSSRPPLTGATRETS